jgi:uncharacterized protein
VAKHFSTLSHDVWLPYKFAVGTVFHRFYEGLKERTILGNRCPSCNWTLVPPRSFCPRCYVDMDEWVDVSQEGEIVTWTWAGRPFWGMPVDPPLVAALIRLDGTDCNLLHLVGGFDLGSPEEVRARIRTGSRVSAVWETNRTGRMLDIRHFEPV